MQLAQLYYSYVEQLVRTGGRSQKTLDGQRRQIDRWLKRLDTFDPPPRSVAELKPYHLDSGGVKWHEVVAVQALFNWAVNLGYIEKSPFRGIEKPSLGARERIMSRAEVAAVMRNMSRSTRLAIAFMRHTLARPGEVRNLRWADYDQQRNLLKLSQFKAKRRRKDRLVARYLPVDGWLTRMLARLARRRQPSMTDYILLTSRGNQISKDRLVVEFRKAAEKAGIRDDGKEKIVPYTVRHTGATAATENGIRDRVLADIMGHTSTRTTARYQHLDTAKLGNVLEIATSRRRTKVAVGGEGSSAGAADRPVRLFNPSDN